MYKIFLKEGQKENAIKKVKKMFPSQGEGETIDYIFNLLSSLGTKYLGFITNETKRFLIDPSSRVDDFIQLMNTRITLFERYNSRITPEIINSSKDRWFSIEERLFPKLELVMNSPKDINSYNLQTLGYILSTLENTLSKKNKEKQAKKDAEKVFEDGDVLVVRALTHDASCYFGKGTRWCTTQSTPQYFDKYTQSGKLYYFIDKSNKRQKVALYVKDGDTSVFDSADKEFSIDFLYNVYPEVVKYVSEKILMGGKIKNGLDKIQSGRISRYDTSDVDPLIYTYSRDNDENVILTLSFDDVKYDYFNLFEFEEGDIDKMYIDMVNSSYRTNDFFDSSMVEDDWKEGYLMRNFDDEQLQRLQKYIKIINPKLYDCVKDLNNDMCASEVSNFLLGTFSEEVSDIITDYTYDANQDTYEGIQKYLEVNYSNMFESYNLPMTGNFYRKEVNLKDLLNVYAKYNPSFTLPIFSLLKKIIQVESISSPEIADYVYEFRGNDYFYGETNQAIEKLLDKMQEYIEENDNISADYETNYDFIKKLGGFDEWFVMPGDNRYTMKIENLNIEDNNITFILHNKSEGKTEKMRLPIEKFKDFVYNLKLF